MTQNIDIATIAEQLAALQAQLSGWQQQAESAAGLPFIRMSGNNLLEK